jgi:hypothetical protein
LTGRVAAMAYKIVVDIVDPGDEEIKVSHIFWGHSEREARTNYMHHLTTCDYFQSAQDEDRLIEEEFEIPEEDLPTAEVDEEGEEGEEIPIFCGKCGKPEDECIC